MVLSSVASFAALSTVPCDKENEKINDIETKSHEAFKAVALMSERHE